MDKSTDQSVRTSTISVLVPLPVGRAAGQQVLSLLRCTCMSLLQQGIDRWELVIGVSLDERASLVRWYQGFVQETKVSKCQLRLVGCPVAQDSRELDLGYLIGSAKGDWVGVAFAGDQFAPHFVYALLMRILKRPSVQLLYFDDDVLTGNPLISRVYPQFKPDFSPDLLLSYNYIGLSMVVRRARLLALTRQAGWHQSRNFPWQWLLELSRDILNDAIGRPPRETCKNLPQGQFPQTLPAWHDVYPIQRIDQVLRHRYLGARTGRGQSARHEQGKAAWLDAKRLVAAFLRREKVPCIVALDRSDSSYLYRPVNRLKLTWTLPDPAPKVSIIVPTKDECTILKVCLHSLLTQTQYPNYEVLVIDNQTTQVSALRYLSGLQASGPRVQVFKYDKPFNYSDINNQAVAHCDGDVLLFLNNDVEVLDGTWLTQMVSHAMRADVGCVGAKLLYPDRTIQHAGVCLGMHGVADHMYRGLEESLETDPYGYLQCVRNTGAVTGAVMAVRRSVFTSVGGFDAKKLPVAFNDVDLCLKAELAGYRTVWTPEACLIHHESKTRAPRKTQGKRNNVGSVKIRSHASEHREIAHMKATWGKLLKTKFHALGQRHEPLRFL
jgi:GT2 family glycosyltransferase